MRRALDQGVNFIDATRSYGTEPFIGAAVQAAGRDSVILSTKNAMNESKRLITAR